MSTRNTKVVRPAEPKSITNKRSKSITTAMVASWASDARYLPLLSRLEEVRQAKAGLSDCKACQARQKQHKLDEAIANVLQEVASLPRAKARELLDLLDTDQLVGEFRLKGQPRQPFVLRRKQVT